MSSFIFKSARFATSVTTSLTPLPVFRQAFNTVPKMSYIIDSQLIDRVAQAEMKLTSGQAAAGNGPFARVQPHQGKELTPELIREVT
jgi:hypothetical protein